ncbi:MAG: hypothetical protein R6U96_00840 [Promethearchaeia archaeon]
MKHKIYNFLFIEVGNSFLEERRRQFRGCAIVKSAACLPLLLFKAAKNHLRKTEKIKNGR